MNLNKVSPHHTTFSYITIYNAAIFNHSYRCSEISARGVLVEQLHKQVDQLKHENCEINSELNTRVVELYSKLSDMSQTLKVNSFALSLRPFYIIIDGSCFVMQATEKELKETKEFMQDENNSLTEALREMEDKASCTSLEVERLNYLLQAKEKHCHSLSQLTEQLE